VIFIGYPIEKKLVVAVSTTALFDLSREHEIYQQEGVAQFRKYQLDNRTKTPEPGAAFPFIKRLLHLNDAYSQEKPIEVVILSRNHPDAALRVMDAIAKHALDITRCSFLAGGTPYPYMQSFSAVLYLSTNKDEVTEAVRNGFPAGYVLPCKYVADTDDKQLRIAFDFDGVLANDEAERVYQKEKDLDMFHAHEVANKALPLGEGPLLPLLRRLSDLQKLDRKRAPDNPISQLLRIAIITARNAPSHERLITTLSELEIETDELFLLGGIDKKNILDVLKPHIFFDDQIGHLQPASETTPSVHIPFGVANEGATKETRKISENDPPA
jgi:5'-nucleotidase